ncbi:hypothetical protein ACFQ1I_46335 [Kitasatospora arboriphila]
MKPYSELHPDLPEPRRELASTLRELGAESGKTTQQIASDAYCSPGAVSQALSGKRRHSWQLFSSIVNAMGGKPESYHLLWIAAGCAAVLIAGLLRLLLAGYEERPYVDPIEPPPTPGPSVPYYPPTSPLPPTPSPTPSPPSSAAFEGRLREANGELPYYTDEDWKSDSIASERVWVTCAAIWADGAEERPAYKVYLPARKHYIVVRAMNVYPYPGPESVPDCQDSDFEGFVLRR